MYEKLLTLEEVREILNTSSAQVYALVRSGALPAMKMGGRGQWRVERGRLDEYIERAHSETATWVRENPMARAEHEVDA
ncbi:helix-turn-helix domain-containing protein [Phytoactinopolyspora halotolerans]|uniref:Helix-turn-helix domain-containing protein n=1 Tax=Phytoactinopolyspora halotolerans TaxID=1981512 RepID=A0A6L9SJW1_9ACTN|nr:helix-turn-helix domain-containing protein [Phytoactinopolyspora halotolerans]NEE04692.1 helix-turn-helix domain-containing protein [Phytoactinopolyspora halotolerans]